MPKNMNIHSAERQKKKANMNKNYVLIKNKFSLIFLQNLKVWSSLCMKSDKQISMQFHVLNNCCADLNNKSEG